MCALDYHKLDTNVKKMVKKVNADGG